MEDLKDLFLLANWKAIYLVCVVHDEMVLPGDLSGYQQDDYSCLVIYPGHSGGYQHDT